MPTLQDGNPVPLSGLINWNKHFKLRSLIDDPPDRTRSRTNKQNCPAQWAPVA